MMNMDAAMYKIFEKAMEQLVEAHKLLAKSNILMDHYNPISKLLAEAKTELLAIYNELKSKTP